MPPISSKYLERILSTGDEQKIAKYILNKIRNGQSINQIIHNEVLHDEYLDIIYNAIKSYFKYSSGFVYIAVNPVLKDIHKIGQTRKTPEERAKTLRTAGVLGTYIIIKQYKVLDRFYCESAIKKQLKEMAIPNSRELFKIYWEELFKITDVVIDKEKEILSSTLQIEHPNDID